MSATRTQRRSAAREHRRRLEEADRRAARVRRAVRRLLYAAVAAAAVVTVLVVVGERSLSEERIAAPAAPAVDRFAGIPQDGTALGDPDAPVTVVEFVDMQCPFCGEFDRTVLPAVVEDYVRSGRVRIELRTMAFLGPDSVRAAQAVSGAAAQDRMWQFVDRFFAAQGAENSGYVTEDFLRDVGSGVPGLDVERALAADSRDAIALAEREARAAGIDSTPSFLVGPTGGELRRAELQSLDAASFAAILDRELAR